MAADAGYASQAAPLGAFLPRVAVFLQKGASYAVRIEYSGGHPDSKLSWQWRPAAASDFSGVPATSLYPLTESVGNGLLGQYFPNASLAGSPQPSVTYGPVDFTWPRPPAAIDGPAFSARWQGQLMAPTSGLYSVTADTDGALQV